MRVFGLARWLMASSATSPNHVIPMNCLHASRQRWSAPSQVNIIDGSSYRILKRSNLQVCQVVDATHGHRHCDYYTIVKVMGGGEASNSEASDRNGLLRCASRAKRKDRSEAKAM